VQENLQGFSEVVLSVPTTNGLDLPPIGNCRVVIDRDVLDIDKSSIKYRPNWIYAMFLKLFQDATKEDLYLTIDADIVLVNPLPMFEGGKRILWAGYPQDHQPYFFFQTKWLDLPRKYPATFIGDMNLISKSMIRQLLKDNGFEGPLDFIKQTTPQITAESHPAENEINGQCCMKYAPTEYERRELKQYHAGGRHIQSWDYQAWSPVDVESSIAEAKPRGFHVAVLHSWFTNNEAQ